MAKTQFKRNATAIALASVIGFGISIGSDLPKWAEGFALMTAAQAADGSAKGPAGPSADHGSKGSKAGDTGGSGNTGASGQAQGQGGPSADSDAKGPRFGGDGSKPTPGTQGGRPVWAKEGISSDVELGRLSVARAPAQVLDRSLTEALTTLSPPFYDAVVAIADNNALTTDQKLAALQALVNTSWTTDTMVSIDSPLQNLALYKDVVLNKQIVSTAATYDASSATRMLLLTAVFVGTASDKTIPISTETVNSLNTIMGITLPSDVTAEDLAKWADAVRVAIEQAHG